MMGGRRFIYFARGSTDPIPCHAVRPFSSPSLGNSQQFQVLEETENNCRGMWTRITNRSTNSSITSTN
jgi:hypothetical protein